MKGYLPYSYNHTDLFTCVDNDGDSFIDEDCTGMSDEKITSN